MSSLRINPITPFIGAEIGGVNLKEPLDAATFGQVHQALMQHLVLVFREQSITPKQHVALASRFGSLSHYDGFSDHPDYPDIQIVQNNAAKNDINNVWHIDSTYLRSPPAVTVLHCVSTPPVGGDTLFSSLYAPYDRLPEPMKTLVGQLSATHDYALSILDEIQDNPSAMDKILRARARHPPITHPLVITHPVTGRKALFVDGSYTRSINDMPWVLGQDLLQLLQKFTQRVEFQMRVSWQVDTVVIWDNRVCQHYAAIDFLMAQSDRPIDRRMHRVTVDAHPNL